MGISQAYLNYLGAVGKVIPFHLISSCFAQSLLAHVIRENSDIKGIKVHNKEVKISLYADGTTIFLKAERESLSSVMRVLDWFKKISGLGVNKEKTKAVKIGRSRTGV